MSLYDKPFTEWEPRDLYDQLERWLGERARISLERTDANDTARRECRKYIRAIKTEMRRRKLPVDRNLYDAQIRAEDARDLQETQRSALDKGIQR